MTNREKYIDKLSDKEFGKLLRHKCYIGLDGKIKTEPIEEKPEGDSMEIHNWLSQEAEEEKIELTKKAYKELLERIDRLEYNDKMNCDKFREIKNKVKQLECKTMTSEELYGNPKHEEITDAELIQQELKNSRLTNQTADEMFEELGYKLKRDEKFDVGSISRAITYQYKDMQLQIKIALLNHEYIFTKVHKDENAYITEAEAKTIHKKIEELKSERESNITNKSRN